MIYVILSLIYYRHFMMSRTWVMFSCIGVARIDFLYPIQLSSFLVSLQYQPDCHWSYVLPLLAWPGFCGAIFLPFLGLMRLAPTSPHVG